MSLLVGRHTLFLQDTKSIWRQKPANFKGSFTDVSQLIHIKHGQGFLPTAKSAAP